VGVDFSPPGLRGFSFGANYYKIDFRNQIATPPRASIVLASPASYGALFFRNPNLAQVDQYIAIGKLGQGFFAYTPSFGTDTNFDPASINVILDLRRRNLSVSDTHGVDLSLAYDFEIGAAKVKTGINGTYIIDLKTQVTPTSVAIDAVSTIYNPPHVRARAFVGWSERGWSANAFVNYTGTYTDNRTATNLPVASFTTIDSRLAYDFSGLKKGGVLDGLTISGSVQNLFDRNPPHLAVVNPLSDMGFDPTNASPLGRLVSLELRKVW
jgi:hypothetical protein